MMKYRKKPVEIEAIQWTGHNLDEVLQFAQGQATYEAGASGNNWLCLQELESSEDVKTKHAATVGDYIIKGIQGEIYACKPSIFYDTYDPVD